MCGGDQNRTPGREGYIFTSYTSHHRNNYPSDTYQISGSLPSDPIGCS